TAYNTLKGLTAIATISRMPTGGRHLMELIDKWKVHDATETYGIRHWSKGYFGINKAGHVTVHPNKRTEQAVDLKELIDQLQARGIQLPILLRFTDILRHRVGEIHDAFDTTIKEFEYQGLLLRLSDQGEPATPRGRGDS